MESYLKELHFPSTEPTYIRDITPEVNGAIKQTQTDSGLVIVNSRHTTLGLIVTEIAEPSLLKDFIEHSLKTIPEDNRSSWVQDREYPYPTTDDYRHYCMDSPLRPPGEMDDDYNGARHERTNTLSHPMITLPYRNRQLELGRYQQIAVWEFDGRDDSERGPRRTRTVQIWVYPASRLLVLDTAIIDP